MTSIFKVSHINVASDNLAWQKSSKMTENTKISEDSAFSFGAIGAKWKDRIDINSRKARFRTKKVLRMTFFAIKIGMKPFNFVKLAKIWVRRDFLKQRSLIQVSWKLSCFV